MIHPFRDKKQIAGKKRLIKNFIFLTIFLIFASLGIFASTSPLIHYIGRPIWKTKTAIVNNLENVSYVVRTKSSVYKDNENLLNENRDLKTGMIDYQILKDENIALKEILGRKPVNKNLILSNILTKPNYSPYDTITIDIGSNLGVNVGDVVYSNAFLPLGEVSAVYANTSLITLYTNPGQMTDGVIEGTNTSVELIGRGGGNFEMSIPVGLPFIKGSFVYLPNLETQIIAVMQDVISLPNDPVKKVILNSPVNVQSLKWVFVNRE